MKPALSILATVLLLAGCSHGSKNGAAGGAENVEMPAEEALSGLDPAATPAPDAEATASAGDDAATAMAPEPAAPAKPQTQRKPAPSPSATPIRM